MDPTNESMRSSEVLNRALSLGATLLGTKGATLAALGEMAAVFLPAPFAERSEGVKLGESTLKPFLRLLSIACGGALEALDL